MDATFLICAILAFLVYVNTLGAGFVYDDRRAILENEDIRTGTLWDLLLHDFWGSPLNHSTSHGSYRPLTSLTFRWTHQLVAFQPFWYHLTNVLLHCVATCQVVDVSRLLVRDRRCVYLSGCLFAVHPVHCEAVAGLVGRADVLATIFFLAGLRIYWSQSHLAAPLTAAATAAAFFCKEYGVTLPAVCIASDIIRKRIAIARIRHVFSQKKYRGLVCNWTVLCGCALLLTTLRLALADFRQPQFSTADNPAAKSASWIARTLTFLHLPAFHFWLLVCPQRLSFDWSMDSIPLISRLDDWRNLATLCFYSALFRIIRKSSNRVTNQTCGLLVALMTIPFIPATNLFVYVGFVAAERILYLPSAGFCLLIACGWDRIRKFRRQEALCSTLALAVVTLMTCRTLRRNADWSDEEALYRSAIRINPPKAYGNLGVILHTQGRLSEAEWSFKQALVHRSNMADVHYNLGNLYSQQSRHQEALQAYTNAIFYRPQLTAAYSQKARVLTSVGRWREAESVLLRARHLPERWVRDLAAERSAQLSTLVQLGQVYSHLGDHQRAVEALNQVHHRWSHLSGDLVNLVADTYRRLESSPQAESWLLNSLEADPANIPAVLTYSAILARNASRIPEAEYWLLRARSLDPTNPAIYRHYGRFLADRMRYAEAADNLVRAADLEPENVASAATAGHALHDAGRNSEAESYFRRALKLEPHEASNLVNLGAVLHVQGNLQEAHAIYLQALRLDPDHQLATTNLRRLQSTWSKKNPSTSVCVTCRHQPARNRTSNG